MSASNYLELMPLAKYIKVITSQLYHLILFLNIKELI